MSDAAQIQELKAQVEALARHVGKLEDTDAIKYLQYTYGFSTVK